MALIRKHWVEILVISLLVIPSVFGTWQGYLDSRRAYELKLRLGYTLENTMNPQPFRDGVLDTVLWLGAGVALFMAVKGDRKSA